MILTLVRRGLILVAAVVALAVPLEHGEQAAPTQTADVEVLVVLDRTRSMAAYDYDGDKPRWDGVKQDLEDLTTALPGARFGLVTFGSTAHLDLPFTTDANAFESAVDTTIVEPVLYAKGSRADRPLSLVLATLERAEKANPDERRFVVFLGDGENTDDQGEQESYEEVAKHISGGAVLGYGTEEGGKMPEADDLGRSEGWVYDYDSGTDAVSHADLHNLGTIADQLGVPLDHRTAPGGVDDIAAGFKADYSLDSDEQRPAKVDFVWVAGLVLALLVLWELFVVWRAVWTTRSVLQPRRAGGKR
ncbi:VWA domain-containing protein [Nocardioides panacisoli]|uniref:VWA domain-containing protein n=1 Tax=Nocardioides panacisoli TaxID=627624 RepID=A0ABP7I173_9ACTN